MTLTFRPAIRTDVAGLATLAARTFPLACPPELGQEAVNSYIAENLSEDAFRGYLVTQGHSILVGVDRSGGVRAYALLIEGTAMSEDCAAIVLGRPTVGVSKFYVDSGLHGTGASRGLLKACVAHVRGDEAASLWLATNVANERARAFYGKNGFVERGNRVFTVGGDDNNDVVLEKPL